MAILRSSSSWSAYLALIFFSFLFFPRTFFFCSCSARCFFFCATRSRSALSAASSASRSARA